MRRAKSDLGRRSMAVAEQHILKRPTLDIDELLFCLFLPLRLHESFI